MDVLDGWAEDRTVEQPASFDAVYAQHAGDVYRFCLSIVGDPARAEDAAAQALASACASYARTAPEATRLRPWLFRIARNAAVDELRREGRWRRLLTRTSASPAHVEDVESQVILRDEVQAVLRASRGLGERDRLIVGLRGAGGLEHAEVAAVLGISEGAAKVAAHRAFRRLRERMEERP